MRLKLIKMLNKIREGYEPKYLVVAVELNTGAIEFITNTNLIRSKIEYYLNAYDDNMQLKANNAIKIKDIMVG